MKKKVLFITICFLIFMTNAFAELTQSDFEKIQTIVEKSVNASENRIKEYVDLKIETLDERIKGLEGRVNLVSAAIIALIAVGIALPQILVARQGKSKQDARFETLEQEIEMLKQKHIAGS